MEPSPPRVGLLAAAVLAAGLLAWLLADGPDPLPGPGPESGASAAGEGAAPSPGAEGATSGAPAASAAPPAGSPADPVPRVLPPDAALEDVRDALALVPATRVAALAEAAAALGRLAAQAEDTARAVEGAIDDEEDPLLRAVAGAALGADRSPTTRTWLRARLAEALDVRERLGALVALGRATEAPGEAEVTCVALGGLRYHAGALPDTPDMHAALERFLASLDGGMASEALPVVARSVRGSVGHAAALVDARGEVCRWLRALPPEARARVVADALAHRDLPASVRRVLEREP